jgi:hypothetical protein
VVAKSATVQLIELAERLVPSGAIGDGKVAQFHELAAKARAELPAISNVQILPGVPRVVPIMDGGRCRRCGEPRL